MQILSSFKTDLNNKKINQILAQKRVILTPKNKERNQLIQILSLEAKKYQNLLVYLKLIDHQLPITSSHLNRV